MAQEPKPSPVVVGKNGFVYADGVRIGKLVSNGVIQVADTDRRRCAEKGRQVVEIRISDLVNLPQQK